MEMNDRFKKIEISTLKATEIIVETPSPKLEIIPLDMDEKDLIELKQYQFLFLFVNPISGSQEGKYIFEIFNENGKEHERHGMVLEFPANDERPDLKVFLFNITLSSSYDLGIKVLNRHIEKVEKLDKYFKKENHNPYDTIVLIGGGDGTVLSVIENLNKKGIDERKCIFGHIPLGTGNDLSNTLGFGSKSI
jgi:hypothetical protein